MAIRLNFTGLMKGPEELLAAANPLTLSVGWQDLGDEIDVRGAQTVFLWLSLTIRNSLNVRVRALLKHTEGTAAVEYIPPIRTVAAAVVTLEDEFLEFNTDADHDTPLSWTLDGGIPFVQFQVQAGFVGTTPGMIDEAQVTSAARSA